MPICVIRDFNEDIILTQEKHCFTMFQSKGFRQIVTMPIHDNGTLIDHIYTNTKLSVKTDVNDCYYTDHDYVLCTISKRNYFKLKVYYELQNELTTELYQKIHLYKKKQVA